MRTKKYHEISYQEFKTYTGIVLHEDGSKDYLLNGQHHRTDGPAIEFVSGHKYWYYHGQFIKVNSQEDFEKYLITLAFE